MICLPHFRPAFTGGDLSAIDPTNFAVVLSVTPNTPMKRVLIPVNAATGGNRTIDWGDGVVETQNGANPTHVYAVDGVYVVKMYGATTTRLGQPGGALDVRWKNTLVRVIQWGTTIGWTNFQDAFRECSSNFKIPNNLPSIAAGFSSNVTNTSWMFAGARAFNQDIRDWNTAAVINMSVMFASTSFNQYIGGWDTSNVTDMSFMFQNQDYFNQDIGSWNTSKVVNMGSMFQNNVAFNQDIGGWNTGNVVNMSFMFSNNQPEPAFNQDIGRWNTSKVSSMIWMFRNATSVNQNIGGWSLRTSGGGTNMSGMLDNCGMSTENYSRTLIGWANSVSAAGNLPTDRFLGADGRTYNNNTYGSGTYTNAVAARNYLTGSPPTWTISGDLAI
jgi:surface protein